MKTNSFFKKKSARKDGRAGKSSCLMAPSSCPRWWRNQNQKVLFASCISSMRVNHCVHLRQKVHVITWPDATWCGPAPWHLALDSIDSNEWISSNCVCTEFLLLCSPLSVLSSGFHGNGRWAIVPSQSDFYGARVPTCRSSFKSLQLFTFPFSFLCQVCRYLCVYGATTTRGST